MELARPANDNAYNKKHAECVQLECFVKLAGMKGAHPKTCLPVLNRARAKYDPLEGLHGKLCA
jgi:hypothetical protein